MADTLPTIRVKHADGHMIINESDFDPDRHELVEGEPELVTSEPVVGDYDELTEDELRAEIEALTKETPPDTVTREELLVAYAALKAEMERRSAVDIPNDWTDLHWTKIAAIANNLAGDDMAPNKEAAVEIVEAELLRRASV